jgi:23S rRNA pseudouridine2605 synthase
MVAADDRFPGTSIPPILLMRLAKHLAHAGVASRRAAESLIAQGRVSVDGETVSDPARDVGESSRILVDGRLLDGPEPRVTYVVHKPVGVVSTAQDTHGRPTVVGLLPAQGLRLYPVGRLDADSSGLILLTNDGELANRLTHPRFEVPKGYRARLAGMPIDESVLRRLREGVELEDGRTAPAEARRLGAHPRGAQPAGATHVLGRRPGGDRAAARALRPVAARRPRRRRVQAARGARARSAARALTAL